MRHAYRAIWARLCFGAILAILVCTPAPAVLPSEKLSDPALEARASELSKRLRCVVCQNQSIDDSAAPIAGDMRVLLRERIAAGATDEEAVGYLVERYGNFVLLKPPFQPDTWFLWLAPFGILLIASVAMFAPLIGRKANARPAAGIDEEESALS
jgi:cytochrome c-type biogenesis protein CcmH